MKQYNEKPSKYSNLGQDIQGAQRHNFDTYENPEATKAKAKAKASKQNKDALKNQALESINETNFLGVVSTYEFLKALEHEAFEQYPKPSEYSSEEMLKLKDFVLSHKSKPQFNTLVNRFNRMSRLVYRLKYRLYSLDDALKHLGPKKRDSFTETNGIKRPWKLDAAFNPESIQYLANHTKAVQFGNSVPDSEREYCLENLAETIKLLKTVINFDYNTVAFSFGARGKAGSIAHYEDANKVLAFNRHWDGALIHELGHAIDYALGPEGRYPYSVYNMPYSIQLKYRDQLRAAKVENLKYYMKPTEIFARMFEQYIRAILPECTTFMQHTFCASVMPELDSEAMEFMSQAIAKLNTSKAA